MLLENKPLVSIVMPAFRSAATLEMAVQGICGQDYRQWELILLLDGADTSDRMIAEQLANADKRIRLIISPENRGVVRMRNLGTRLAKGQWLAFCDADDYWLPTKLSLQLKSANEQQLQVVCSSFWFWLANREQESWRKVNLPRRLNAAAMLKTNAIPMSTAMYHLHAIGRQYFSPMPKGLIHEDYDFWLKIMMQPGINAACLSEPTTMIRVQPNSRSANKWLALKSHAYILKKRGGLKGVQLIWCMFHYAAWGMLKRFAGKKEPKNPFTQG